MSIDRDPALRTLTARNRVPLTVLHCRSSATLYGPERSLLLLAGPLANRGIGTRILALYRRDAADPEIHPFIASAQAAGIRADQVLDPGPFSLTVVRRMARRVRASGADVLHTHDYKTNILGGLVARRPDRALPWVATVHLHTGTSRRLRLYRTLDLFLLRLADRVITVSRDQCHMLLKRGVDRSRLVLIPTVLDSDAFRARLGEPGTTRARLAVAPDAPMIALVGRLTTQKGVDDFLAAAGRVHHARPDARFVVVGNGPLRASLEREAGALGLDGAVSFLGYQVDVAPILGACDVVAMPSRSEGLPLALLEALAAARPVVASRVGGIPDVVRDGETGILVPPNNPERMAAALLDLIADPARARALGDAGRRHVAQHCSPEHAARRLAFVYRAALADRL